MIDQGWDRWEMISLIFMSRFKFIVHRDRDIFGLCRAGLKRPAAMLSSSSRIQYEALFVVSLNMTTWCVFELFVFDEIESGINRCTDGFFWSPSRTSYSNAKLVNVELAIVALD